MICCTYNHFGVCIHLRNILKTQSIFKDDYNASHLDVWKTRITTTEMIEATYEINDAFFNVYDMDVKNGYTRLKMHLFF